MSADMYSGHFNSRGRRIRASQRPRLWTLDRVREGVEMIPFSGCWIWLRSVDRGGYGFASVHVGQGLRSRTTRVTRIVWWILTGHWTNAKADEVVMHKCDTPSCVNPDHLRLGTYVDNKADCMAKGRSSSHRPPVGRRGEHPRAKVTPEIALAARAELGAGATRRALAAKYAVSNSVMSKIALGQHWTVLGAVPIPDVRRRGAARAEGVKA